MESGSLRPALGAQLPGMGWMSEHNASSGEEEEEDHKCHVCQGCHLKRRSVVSLCPGTPSAMFLIPTPTP